MYVHIKAKAGMRRDSVRRPIMELVFLTLTEDEFFEDPQIAKEWTLGVNRLPTLPLHQLFVRNSEFLIARELQERQVD